LLTELPILEFRIDLAKLQKLGTSPSNNLQFLTPNEFGTFSQNGPKAFAKYSATFSAFTAFAFLDLIS
jgi:hypothetical protein